MKFEVREIRLDETPEIFTLEARGRWEAVILWAISFDAQNDEFRIARGEVLEVEIRLAGDSEWMGYAVTGEMMPRYDAELLS